MADKKGYSRPGLFGDINHYDSKGHKIGESHPGLFGGYTNYDASGKKVGRSDPGLFGGYTHYDNKGKKIGHSDPGLFGSYNHYDTKNKRTGSSDPGMFGGYNHKSSSQGCYIATCVYGSYDCPQVWTLRRFRDNVLAEKWYGRAFISGYYKISPALVRVFGSNTGFRRFWTRRLNKIVALLNNKGLDSTPYVDPKYPAQIRRKKENHRNG